MSDVFRARFDGLEWWARDAFEEMAPDYQRVLLWPLVAGSVPPEKHVGPSLCVPAHMVERVEDIPPEPTEPGTVMYDREGVAWQRGPAGWYGTDGSGGTVRSNWHALRHPLHPYPRAAREEIERLTAKVAEGQRLVEEMAPVLIERDVLTAQLADAKNAGTDIAEERDVATAEIERLTAERDRLEWAAVRADKEKARADELQRRIDRALSVVDDPGYWSAYNVTRPKLAHILRGEVDQ
jgi:hypothetical protein